MDLKTGFYASYNFLPVKGCSLKRVSSSLLQSRTSRIDCFESCKLVCEKKLNVGKFRFTARILPDFFFRILLGRISSVLCNSSKIYLEELDFYYVYLRIKM